MQCGEDSDVEVALIFLSFTPQGTVGKMISSECGLPGADPRTGEAASTGTAGTPSAVLSFWNLSWPNKRLKMSSLCKLPTCLSGPGQTGKRLHDW